MQSRPPTTRFKLARFLALLTMLIVFSIPEFSTADGRPKGPAQSDEFVSVSVMSLFHPREFVVRPSVGRALILQAGPESIVLENSGVAFAAVRIDGSDVVVSS